MLRDQLMVVPFPNDSAVHLAFVRWARARLEAGLSLDGWFPNLGLGVTLTHHYQAAPELVTAMLSGPLGVDATYRWLTYLILCSWPLSVYLGVRLLGWEPWVAGAAAFLSPLLVSVTGYGFEHGSYTWQGTGLYTQLWGMWLLPPALGLGWQAVSTGRRVWAAALLMAALIACHFLTAYLALLLIGVFALVAPAQLRERLPRALAVNCGALLLAAPILVPVLLDSAYNLRSTFNQGTFREDSWGAPRVLGWLAGGRLFDEGRLAVISAFATLGLVQVARRARTELPARAILAVLLVSVVLFSGRPTFGPELALLPGSQDLLFHRFLSGIQVAGLLIGGVGAVGLAGWLGARIHPRPVDGKAAMIGAAACALLAVPAAIQVAQLDGVFAGQARNQLLSEAQAGAQFRQLVRRAGDEGGGRVYAGSPSDFGNGFRIGYIPTSIELLNLDAEGVGYRLRVPSLAADAEAELASGNPANLELLGIRFVIAPSSQVAPAPAAEIVERTADLTLWRLPGGYLGVGTAVAPTVRADRSSIGRVDARVLGNRGYGTGAYQYLDFPGVPAPAPAAGAPAAAGVVESQRSDPAGGRFDGAVRLTEPGLVVLRTSFDPNWTATVDGKPERTAMVVPGFPAVSVPAGPHEVSFEYRSFDGYPILLVIAGGALVLLGAGPRLLQRVRRVDRGQSAGDRDDDPGQVGTGPRR